MFQPFKKGSRQECVLRATKDSESKLMSLQSLADVKLESKIRCPPSFMMPLARHLAIKPLMLRKGSSWRRMSSINHCVVLASELHKDELLFSSSFLWLLLHSWVCSIRKCSKYGQCLKRAQRECCPSICRQCWIARFLGLRLAENESSWVFALICGNTAWCGHRSLVGCFNVFWGVRRSLCWGLYLD